MSEILSTEYFADLLACAYDTGNSERLSAHDAALRSRLSATEAALEEQRRFVTAAEAAMRDTRAANAEAQRRALAAESALVSERERHAKTIRDYGDAHSALAAEREAHEETKGPLDWHRKELEIARGDADSERARAEGLEEALHDAEVVIRRITENHDARITERGILVYGQPFASTGFVEALEWLAALSRPAAAQKEGGKP